MSNYFYVFTSKWVQCINTVNLIIGKSLTIMIHFQTWDQEGKWTQIYWVCTYFELIFKLQKKKKEDTISFIFSLSLSLSLMKSHFSSFSIRTSSLCHFFFRIKAIIIKDILLKPVSVCSLEWNILVPVNFEYRFGNCFEITAKIYIYILLLLYKIINLI